MHLKHTIFSATKLITKLTRAILMGLALSRAGYLLPSVARRSCVQIYAELSQKSDDLKYAASVVGGRAVTLCKRASRTQAASVPHNLSSCGFSARA